MFHLDVCLGALSRALNTPLEATADLSVLTDDPDDADRDISVELKGRAETSLLDVPRTFQFELPPA